MDLDEAPVVFGANIRFLREKYSLPRKSLSKHTGISLPVLRMTEQGEVMPRLTQETIMRLCRIFDVTPDELLHTRITE